MDKGSVNFITLDGEWFVGSVAGLAFQRQTVGPSGCGDSLKCYELHSRYACIIIFCLIKNDDLRANVDIVLQPSGVVMVMVRGLMLLALCFVLNPEGDLPKHV